MQALSKEPDITESKTFKQALEAFLNVQERW